MKIIGYSERGAMNALFYGMANDTSHGVDAMNTFLSNLARMNNGPFSDFTIYSEFSLSDFGEPDMMITAKDKEGKNVLFFIEAKVSCGSYYDLSKQLDKHKKKMNYDSSNLFFQLRLKQYFVQRIINNTLDNKTDDHLNFFPEELKRLVNRGKDSKNNLRYIGKNVIVNKTVKKLEAIIEPGNVYYIAIIPRQDDSKESKTLNEVKETYGLDFHIVTWERICKEEMLKDYVALTIDFNKEDDKNKSQILNRL